MGFELPGSASKARYPWNHRPGPGSYQVSKAVRTRLRDPHKTGPDSERVPCTTEALSLCVDRSEKQLPTIPLGSATALVWLWLTSAINKFMSWLRRYLKHTFLTFMILNFGAELLA
jgi:hypothetical protein